MPLISRAGESARKLSTAFDSTSASRYSRPPTPKPASSSITPHSSSAVSFPVPSSEPAVASSKCPIPGGDPHDCSPHSSTASALSPTDCDSPDSAGPSAHNRMTAARIPPPPIFSDTPAASLPISSSSSSDRGSPASSSNPHSPPPAAGSASCSASSPQVTRHCPLPAWAPSRSSLPPPCPRTRCNSPPPLLTSLTTASGWQTASLSPLAPSSSLSTAPPPHSSHSRPCRHQPPDPPPACTSMPPKLR